jgi:hypothetical protein
MESQWLFLSVDELLYRFHLYVAEPIISFLSFQWVRRDGGDALQKSELGVEPQMGFFERWFIEPVRSVIEVLSFNYQEASFGEVIRGILFGSAEHASVFEIIFGSFLGWILILAIFALLLRWYLKERIDFMEKRKALLYDLENTGHVHENANRKRERWERIVAQINSDDVNQWKVAIMDADSLLDEVLYEQGYSGDGVAAKLQQARKDDFDTLRYAQEAHGIRNRIAHDAGYALSHREAKLAVASYERFFNELYHM